MFAFDSIYLTPPQTPVLLVNEEDHTSDHDNGEGEVELELLTVNYTKNEKHLENERNSGGDGLYIRRDLMWGNNSDITTMDSESSISCYEKRLRDRALITPLNFSSSEDDCEDDMEKSSEDGSFKGRLSVSSLDISFNEIEQLLLSPTETESSEDDEIDVVGLKDDESFYFSNNYMTVFRTVPSGSFDSVRRDNYAGLHQNIVHYDDVGGSLSDSSTDERSSDDSEPASIDSVEASKHSTRFRIPDREENPPTTNLSRQHKRTRRKRNKIKEEAISTDTSSSEESTHNTKRKSSRKIPKSHNSSEKKRRDVLKCKFIELRSCIPDLCEYEKAPKIVILSTARELVAELQNKEIFLLNEKEKELEKKEMLTKKLISLESSFASRFEPKHSRYTIKIP